MKYPSITKIPDTIRRGDTVAKPLMYKALSLIPGGYLKQKLAEAREVAAENLRAGHALFGQSWEDYTRGAK